MRILICVTSHVSYRLVQGQISYLSNLGHTVHFASTFNEETRDFVIKEGGVYHSIEMQRELSFFRDILTLINVFKLLYRIRPDIINASTPKAGFLFMLAARLAFTLKTKKIFTLRGVRSDTLSGLKRSVVRIMEKLSCYFADKVIVISPSLKEHACKIGLVSRKHATVIGAGSSNGIDTERFRPLDDLSSIQALRRSYNIPVDALVFGYVGRMVRDKGVAELYEAFKKMRDKYDSVYLLLIGSRDESDVISPDLLREIDNDGNVVSIDYTSRIQDFFPLMDVFILFSYREGFGNVVLEAAGMGVPAIVSDIPGLRDTIVENMTGLLAESKNVMDLFVKMEQLYLERDLIKEYGSNATRRVNQLFENKIIWHGQLEIYQKLYHV